MRMNYTPRLVFKDFHNSNFKRALMVCHRRAGKTVASAAETMKRAYNGPDDGQYIWLSPLGEQSILNAANIFRNLDDQGYIDSFSPNQGIITLANGAQIQLGGDRTAEKYRGRRLDGCFSATTQVLTAAGWLPFKQAVATPNLKFAQYDQNTHSISFDFPTKIMEFYDREVLTINLGERCGSVTCTPNHQWLVKDHRTNVWKKVQTTQLTGHHIIPRAATPNPNSAPLSPIQQLAIALQADGCLTRTTKSHNYWSVSFAKQRKIKRFRQILKDAGIKEVSNTYPSKPNHTAFHVKTPHNITKKLQTFFDLESTPAYAFMQEIALWDGSIPKQNPHAIYYSSTDKDNTDFVQAMAVLAGYTTHTSTQIDNRSDKFSDVYRLYCRPVQMLTATIKNKTIHKEHQTVYCVEMPKHNIIVRTEKSAVISGNCVMDEFSQLKPTTWSEIISYALADRNGWAIFIGTARTDDNYRLYNMYKQYKDNPNWFTKMVGVLDNPEAFPPERVQEIKDEHINFCLNAGLSMEQALQSFNVEFLCDFSFIDQGKPDMQALFYTELSNLFTPPPSSPSRLLAPNNPKLAAVQNPSVPKIAIFDISHSTGRDYTCALYAAELPNDMPLVYNIEWENNQPLAYWFNKLKLMNIQNVALPFDANSVNKETLLSLAQTFKREGFNVIKFKRLLRQEQIENGRWLLNNCYFTQDTTKGLGELGKFREFQNKHGLEQDIASAVLYAGQVLRKKHTKMELANTIKMNYNKNQNSYNTGISIYSDKIHL